MFNRLSTSWELVKASAAVLAADKELIIFPIVSAIGTLLVTLTFAIPTFLSGIFDQTVSERGGIPVTGIIIAFLFYLTQYFVIFFANSALVGAALIRLHGGDPTVSDGFSIAFKHIGPIFGYALLSATVGMILRAISRRGGIIGQIASSLFGLAWNLATYLVVPILVVEDVGPIEAVKRSAQYLKKTWGEQIVGNVSISLVFGLIFFVIIVLAAIVGSAVLATKSVAIIAAMIFLFVMVLIIMGLISSALSGIYAAAVYRYAAEGEVGNYFSRELVTNAFRAN